MAPVPRSRLQPSRDVVFEEWHWLDGRVLRSGRSRQARMTCLSLLSAPPWGQLHQGLVAHGEPIATRRSPVSHQEPHPPMEVVNDQES